jgi:hypothetical protein
VGVAIFGLNFTLYSPSLDSSVPDPLALKENKSKNQEPAKRKFASDPIGEIWTERRSKGPTQGLTGETDF